MISRWYERKKASSKREKANFSLHGWDRSEQLLLKEIKNIVSLLENSFEIANYEMFRQTLYFITGSLCGVLTSASQLANLYSAYTHNNEIQQKTLNVFMNTNDTSSRWKQTLMLCDEITDDEAPFSNLSLSVWISCGVASLLSVIDGVKKIYNSPNNIRWDACLDDGAKVAVIKICGQFSIALCNSVTSLSVQDQLQIELRKLEDHRNRRNTFLLFKSDKCNNTGLQLLLQTDQACNLIEPILDRAGLGRWNVSGDIGQNQR